MINMLGQGNLCQEDDDDSLNCLQDEDMNARMQPDFGYEDEEQKRSATNSGG